MRHLVHNAGLVLFLFFFSFLAWFMLLYFPCYMLNLPSCLEHERTFGSDMEGVRSRYHLIFAADIHTNY